MRRLFSLVMLAGFGAAAEETTISVPQGSGVFPTVGQVNCLEEMGSGRFCAATYECADDSGELWGDLANHDGRRAIGVDSPVTRQRDCSITVDGKAAVRWFTGFSPDGRDGELVGVTAKHDAEPPVIQRVATGGSGGSGSFLSWFVDRYEIDNLVEAVRHNACGHFVEGTSQRSSCLEITFPRDLGVVGRAMAWEHTPFTECATEFVVDFTGYQALSVLSDDIGSCRAADSNSKAYSACAMMSTLAMYDEHPGMDVSRLPGRYAECRTLFEEQWENEGFGELP